MKCTKLLSIQKYKVFQGWESSFSAIGQFGTSQQHSIDIQNAEKWLEAWHSHSWKDGQCDTLPCSSMGAPSKQDLEISGYNTGPTGLCSVAPWQTGNPCFTLDACSALHSMCLHLQCSSWLWAAGNRHPLPTIWGGHGNVSLRRAGIYHYANRQMVKWCFSVIHSQTSQAILYGSLKQMITFCSFRTMTLLHV